MIALSPQEQCPDHLPRPHRGCRAMGTATSPPPRDTASSDSSWLQRKVLLQRKRSRGDIETSFRDTKQLAGRAPASAGYRRLWSAASHSSSSPSSYSSRLRLAPSETREVKRRLHLSVIRGDQSMSGAAVASTNHGCCVSPVRCY
jgi:hypothetical protein